MRYEITVMTSSLTQGVRTSAMPYSFSNIDYNDFTARNVEIFSDLY